MCAPEDTWFIFAIKQQAKVKKEKQIYKNTHTKNYKNNNSNSNNDRAKEKKHKKQLFSP